MPQNTPHNQPEQEKTSFEGQEKQTPKPQQPKPETARPQPETTTKPEIPETTKPEMPKEEGIPKGGPGDQQAQAQAQTQAQPQAPAQTQANVQPASTSDQVKKERLHKIKGQLNIKIPAGTPAERKVSGKIEDWHSNNILNQP